MLESIKQSSFDLSGKNYALVKKESDNFEFIAKNALYDLASAYGVDEMESTIYLDRYSLLSESTSTSQCVNENNIDDQIKRYKNDHVKVFAKFDEGKKKRSFFTN